MAQTRHSLSFLARLRRRRNSYRIDYVGEEGSCAPIVRVNRLSIGTPYRRAKGTPLLKWWVVDAGRSFRAAGDVGRA
jgi:hypothetical protein